MNAAIKPMGDKRKFALNFIAQMAVLGSQFIISFVLTPVVLAKLGDEAYGFVGLVNSFVNYVTIVTAALNAMASRFITVAYLSDKKRNAEEYFSSVFFSDCVMAVAILAGSIFLAMNIEFLVNVAPNLVTDLRITIFIAFLNAAIGWVSVVFGVAAFIKNELFLNSVGQLLGSLLRVILLFTLFFLALPHMWYFSLAGLVATVSTSVVQWVITKKLLPDIKISFARFSPSKIWELLKIGVWNSLQNINQLIQVGLDLLIANLFVSSAAMGLLSVAKTVPLALTSLSGSIASLFYPKIAQAYARKDKNEFVNRLDFAMRFTSAFMIVPLAGFIGFGPSFYSLWLPGRAAAELGEIQVLSVLTVVTLLASALVEPLYYANTLTIKIKGSVLIAFAFSLATLAIEFPLLVCSSIDKLFVIAGTSSVLMSLRHAVIQPLYCAIVIKAPKRTFYKPLSREVLTLVLLLFAYLAVDSMGFCNSWGALIAVALIAVPCGYLVEFFILFNSNERDIIISIVRDKLGGMSGAK